MTNLSAELRLLLFIAIAGAVGACSEGRTTENRSVVDAGPSKVVDAGAKKKSKRVRPEYDERGIPLPGKAQGLGVALPRGFDRLGQDRGSVTYGGKIPARKLYEFYREYLDCLQVSEVRRGWRFTEATPRAPGDPSRSVDVTVLDGRGQSSLVVVIDRMSRSKIPSPDGGVKTHEELLEATHKGTGTVKRPIPGTY